MIKSLPAAPRPVRLYLGGLVGLSIVLAVGSVLGLSSGLITSVDRSLLGGVTLLIALATARPVKLRVNVNLSLRIAPQLMAAVLLGPACAMIAAGVGVLAGYVYLLRTRRTNSTDLVFNTAQGILSTTVAAVLYELIATTGLGSLGEPLALFVAAEGLHLSNTWLVATAMVLSGQSSGLGRTFWRLFTSHALAYAALLITGILGVLLARTTFWAVPLLVVPLVLVERTLLAEQAENRRQREQADANARLYQQAQEAVTVRDEFLRRAAHELKTPITNLLGYTQLLQRQPARVQPVPEREQRMLRTIGEQGIRLHQLVVTLLDLSRLQSGQLVIEQRPVDLCALVQRLVAESQPTLAPGTIAVHGASASLMIEGDELRLEQVIYNLLQNAIKYSPANKPIEVWVGRRSEQACLLVRDYGIGIPPAALPHIFERFYQVPRGHVQQSSGFGIGLYIVNEIVGAHGGRMEVCSTIDQGSTFTVYLPCSTAAAPAPELHPV